MYNTTNSSCYVCVKNYYRMKSFVKRLYGQDFCRILHHYHSLLRIAAAAIPPQQQLQLLSPPILLYVSYSANVSLAIYSHDRKRSNRLLLSSVDSPIHYDMLLIDSITL